MCPALDSITRVEVLAAIPRVRRTPTNAAPVNAAAVSPAVHLRGKLAVVNDRFAHASTVAFVALAQAVDTRAVRSAVHLHGKLAGVNGRFAHASSEAFVALAQTVDTRAVRSTAIA